MTHNEARQAYNASLRDDDAMKLINKIPAAEFHPRVRVLSRRSRGFKSKSTQ